MNQVHHSFGKLQPSGFQNRPCLFCGMHGSKVIGIGIYPSTRELTQKLLVQDPPTQELSKDGAVKLKNIKPTASIAQRPSLQQRILLGNSDFLRINLYKALKIFDCTFWHRGFSEKS